MREEVYIICEKILSKECDKEICNHKEPHYEEFFTCDNGYCSYLNKRINCVPVLNDFFSEEEFEI